LGNLYTVAGQKFYIGSAPMATQDEDFEAADFDSVTWIEVKKWQQMGALGDTAALITTPLINNARDVKQKGTRNAGSMQNVFAEDLTDAGQQAMIAAEATDDNYPFKVVGADIPSTGSAPAASQRLFVGIVMSSNVQGGAANTAQMLACTVEVNSNVVVVPATEGSAPTNVVLPAISGTPQEGEVLTVWPGAWTGGVNSFTYQWKKAGVDIAGATTSTYTPVSGDVGDAITCVVTAHNGAGTTPATSAATIDVVSA
jgi:hypothetical protein